ncbi:adenosine deaminase [Corticibacter populi]|uniref:Adenosine deaminase n=1 Tax=Corticibacter populi TaxID=1550736 RepID=A0A3M6QRR5_9BURK|nr:adenosine deaminase [Corticibacter populi]RMX05735.1 adenosine deaminase [Corticibacter populi]RZS30967.1 adenosine deaminase [Corticibacter populi]
MTPTHSSPPPSAPELARRLPRLPKVDLHLHLAGALRPATLAELATRHGLALPRPVETLYQYRDFYDFIDVLRLGAQAVRQAADFERIAYEAIEDAACSGARHVEMSFNPQYFMPTGVPYRVQLEGLAAGVQAARRDFDCSALLIAALDRGLPMDSAEQAIDDVLSLRHELVVGIGLDGPERAASPAAMAALFQRAGRAGLRRTAHVCEDNQTLAEAPPSNVDDCIELMGCDRLDHGYNLLASQEGLQRARERGVYFCVCGVTSVKQRQHHRLQNIRAMADAGLPLTLNTDDPAMFHTNLNHNYATVLQACGWGWSEACRFSLAGVDACWLDDDAKHALRQRFEREIAVLDAAPAMAARP